MKPENRARVHLSLEPDLLQWLEEQSAERRCSVSAFVRLLIAERMQAERRQNAILAAETRALYGEAGAATFARIITPPAARGASAGATPARRAARIEKPHATK